MLSYKNSGEWKIQYKLKIYLISCDGICNFHPMFSIIHYSVKNKYAINYYIQVINITRGFPPKGLQKLKKRPFTLFIIIRPSKELFGRKGVFFLKAMCGVTPCNIILHPSMGLLEDSLFKRTISHQRIARYFVTHQRLCPRGIITCFITWRAPTPLLF